MYVNKKIYLYLKSNNYKVIGPFDCYCYSTVINQFNNNGNFRSEINKVFIPLANINFDIQAKADIDIALIDDVLEPLQAEVDGEGNLTNGSDLLRNGAKIITLASKKDYGSPNMQHYYLEVE